MFQSSKCSKFVLGKKSAIGDKPATRKHERPIAWDRIPFATQEILTAENVEAQKQTVSPYSWLTCPTHWILTGPSSS